MPALLAYFLLAPTLTLATTVGILTVIALDRSRANR